MNSSSLCDGEGDTTKAENISDDEATRVAARRLLASLTGRSPGSKREEFERAFNAEGYQAKRILPEPSCAFPDPG